MTEFMIVAHYAEHPDRQMYLCGDGNFRGGIQWFTTRDSTLAYKSLKRAMKRFATVKGFPNAAIIANDGGVKWLIKRI